MEEINKYGGLARDIEPDLQPQVELEEQTTEPTEGFGMTLGAMLATENVIFAAHRNAQLSEGYYNGSGLSPEDAVAVRQEWNPDFDPFAHIEGTQYAQYASAFSVASNEHQVNVIKRQIDDELFAKSILANSDLKNNLGAAFVAGVLSPEMLIPAGAAVSSVRSGGAMLKTVGKTAAIGGGVSVLTEAQLHGLQHTRTLDESIVNVTTETILSGLLGGAGKFIGDAFHNRKVSSQLRERLMTDFGLEGIEKIKVKVDRGVSVEQLADAINTKQLKLAELIDAAPDSKLIQELEAKINGAKTELEGLRQPIPEPTPPKDLMGVIKELKAKFMGQGMPARAAKKLAQERAPAQKTKLDKLFNRDVTDHNVRQQYHTDSKVKPAEESIAKMEAELEQLKGQVKASTEASYKLVALQKHLKENGVNMDTARKLLDGDELPFEDVAVYVSNSKKVKDATLDDAYDLGFDEPKALSSAAVKLNAEDMDLVSSGKIAELSKNLTPILRLTQSVSNASREVWEQLGSDNLLRKGNAKGVARRQSVEDKKKLWKGELSVAIRVMRENYKLALREMKKAGIDTKSITLDSFSADVTRALRKPEVESKNPYQTRVIETAKYIRKYVFDRYEKALRDLDMLDEKRMIKNYVPQLWNQAAINSNPKKMQALLEKLIAHYRKDNPDFDANDAWSSADEILRKLRGIESGQLLTEVDADLVGGSARLKERTLNIPDELQDEFDEFLHTDIEKIMKSQYTSLAGEIEVVRAFGDREMRDAIESIKDDYQNLIDKAGSAKEVDKLKKLMQRDMDDIRSVRDRVMDNGRRVGKWPDRLLKVNLLTKLGGMVVSAIPDIARPIMVYGMRRYLGHMVRMMRDMKKFNLTAVELQRAGAAADLHLGYRSGSMLNGDENLPMAESRFDRALDTLANGFGRWTGMEYWNHGLKRFTASLAQDTILDNLDKFATGSLKSSQVQHLTRLGLSDVDAKAILKELKRDGVLVDGGGVKAVFYDKFHNQELADKLKTAIVSEVDTIINTPTLGSLPRSMAESVTAKLIFQFKSFLITAHQQTLIAGVQRTGLRDGDMNFLMGSVFSTGLGMLTYAIKDYQRQSEAVSWSDHIDKILSNPSNTLIEAIDHSGLATLLFEANNLSDTLTGVSLQGLTGNESSRFQNRNGVGAALGVSFGTGEDVRRVASKLLSDKDWTTGDTKAARRIIPYQNLFYMRSLFDKAERSFNDAFGIERTQKKDIEVNRRG